MIFITHIIFSLCIYSIFYKMDLLSILLLSFGSLFPDIDRSTSKLGRKFKFIEKIFGHRKFFHSLFGLLFFSALFYFLFDYVFLQNISIFPEDKSTILHYTILFFFGYLSHIFLDSFNPKGILFFYPFSFKDIFKKILIKFDRRKSYLKKYDTIFLKKNNYISFFKIKSGSIGEIILFILLLSILFYLIFYKGRLDLAKLFK